MAKQKKLQKQTTTFARAVIYDKQLGALSLRPEPAYPFAHGHCFYDAIAQVPSYLKKSGGRSHIPGTSSRYWSFSWQSLEGLLALRIPDG